MCLICVDFERGRLTAKEARRALGEMVETLDAEHVAEIEAALDEADAKGAADPSSTP